MDVPAAARLRGTASFRYVHNTGKKPKSVDCSKVTKQECKTPSHKRCKTVLKCCFPCIRKGSESYTVGEAQVAGKERDTQDRAARECGTQDKGRDAHLKYLIAVTGRPACFCGPTGSESDCADYQGENETLVKVQGPGYMQNSRNSEFEADGTRSGSCLQHNPANRTARSALSAETLIQESFNHRKLTFLKQEVTSPKQEVTSPKQEVTSPKQEVTSLKQEVTSPKQEVTSPKQEVTSPKQEVTSPKQEVTSLKQEVTKEGGVEEDVDPQMTGLDRDAQHVQGSLVEDLKETLRAVSADLNQTNTSAPRPSVRKRALCIKDIQKMSWLQPKDLDRFRYPPAHHLMPQTMMFSGHRFRHPRFSDFNARKESFRNCRDEQLSGYNQAELARAGWFFNQGVLITFCCELPLPSHPAGSLQHIHQEQSPECHFAASLQTSAPDSGVQTGGAEWSLSGGRGVQFSTPVQVSDHDPGQPYILAEHSGVVDQESSPGNHWHSDWSGPDRILTVSSASYPASLVTNATQLTPAWFEPFVEDQRQRPRNREETQGQLTMRGMVPNPLVSRSATPHDGVLENLGHAEALLDYLAHFDQLNMNGAGDVEHRPRHPHFGAPPIRNESFQQGWPADHSHTACSLADAGFFYGGYGDSVLCYSCGIGVRRWVPGDDPWIEHARLRPSCVFVKTVQGQHFIDAAREMTANNQHPTYRDVKLEANRRQQAEEGDRAVLAGISFRAEDAGIELLCKFCYRRESTHLMIPCNHMAVCEECSWPQLSCPDCHAYVEETFQP